MAGLLRYICSCSRDLPDRMCGDLALAKQSVNKYMETSLGGSSDLEVPSFFCPHDPEGSTGSSWCKARERGHAHSSKVLLPQNPHQLKSSNPIAYCLQAAPSTERLHAIHSSDEHVHRGDGGAPTHPRRAGKRYARPGPKLQHKAASRRYECQLAAEQDQAHSHCVMHTSCRLIASLLQVQERCRT